jgi:hypothetical protein
MWKGKVYWSRLQGCHSWVQSEVAWLNWIVGFIGVAQPWGRERVSGLWLSAITRWNRLTCLGSWVTGSSWVVLQAKKQSGREKQVVINQEVWFWGVASGPSTSPKNARDLTFQPFVGIMGTDWSSCFVLSGGVIKEGSAGIWKFVRSSGVEADGLSQAAFADKAICWEKVVVASGGKSVCWVP